ncbi:polysaccharide deacetylase family protein [Streptomyces chiangmaiensis]
MTRSTQTAPPARTNRHALRRDPRAHWLLLLLILAVAATALLFSGYGRHEIAPTGAPAHHCTAAPAAVRAGGPLLSEADGKLHSAHLPAERVALTYDGGPDPAWTPALLDVLKKHHVKATFFLSGTQVAAHPDLVRRIHDEGHQIGSHTYTDANLAQVSVTRARLELAITQNTLAGAAGLGTRLVRLPHTGDIASLCADQWAAGRGAIDDGYILVAADAADRSPKGVRSASSPARRRPLMKRRESWRPRRTACGSRRSGRHFGCMMSTTASRRPPRRRAPPSCGCRPCPGASPTP